MVRPKTKEKYKRELLSIRLPNWILSWLYHQKESSGKVIEKALIDTYKLEDNEKD